METRMYHVVAINEKTGKKTYCTVDPVTHDEGCTMLRKFSSHPARRVQLEELIDSRSGFYYVSAIDGPRKALISGPYPSHQEALDAVGRVKDKAYQVDVRAIWYAWGTARSENDMGPGVLGRL